MAKDNRAALEAAIDHHPNQATNYLVLADLLQEQQNPRGELIVLYKKQDPVSNARALTLQQTIGPPGPRYGSSTWFYGFVQSFRSIIDEDDAAWLRGFLDHPSLRHVISVDLDLAGSEHDDRQWLPDLLAERARPSWRSLTINSYWRGGNDPPAGELDLSKLWAMLPRLETLRVTARNITPGALASPTLCSLAIDGEVSAEELQPLLELSAPDLCELELTDVGARFGTSLADSPLAAKLAQVTLPYVGSQAALRTKLPNVTFLGRETGDRYEQTGE